MKSQSLLTIMFITSWLWLCGGLLKFVGALSNYGVAHNFVAENWGVPAAVLLAIVFALGWWGEYMSEQLMLSKKRKTAVVVYLGYLLLFFLLLIGPYFISTLSGFWHSVMTACALFLMSGLFLRFSAADLNKIAELRKANSKEHN